MSHLKPFKRKQLAQVLKFRKKRKVKTSGLRRTNGVVSACVSHRELDEITRLCRRWDLNMSATVRLLVRIGLKEHGSWTEPNSEYKELGVLRLR